jgi:glycosyltransferase involved in cell wall biosynthesis
MISTNEIPEQVVGLFDGDTDPRPVMVTIRCITYNHEAYIGQALEGFVMQKTNFRFEAIVHDDASTDGTAAIIREYAEKYPGIIRPIYETENQYSKGNGSINRIMNAAARGKYIAVCEGDDYWTDPYKLQKQVDILTNNPDVGLIYTNVNFYYQESGKMEVDVLTSGLIPRAYSFRDHLYNGGYIAPCTWMVKKEIIMSEIPESVDRTFCWALEAFANSKVYFLNETTTVYRYLCESASHISSIKKQYDRIRGINAIVDFYKNKYSNLLSAEDLIQVEKAQYRHAFMNASVVKDFDFLKQAREFYLRHRFYKLYAMTVVASTWVGRYIIKVHKNKKGIK